jgi:hypothetical protein
MMWRRKLLAVAASLALALGALSARANAQAPLEWSQNVPGNSKPIILYADDITTWTEKGSRIFLLKGRVWIEQGVVQVQMQQGTLWVDESKKQRSGIYQVDVYADGEVTLHDGPRTLPGLKGHIELNTRGEIHLRSYRGKVAQSPTPADPLFLRAVTMKYHLAEEAAKAIAKSKPAAPIQTASQKSPPAAVAPATNTLQVSGYTPPPARTPPAPPTAAGQPMTLPAITPPTPPRPAAPAVQLGLPQ